MHVQQQIQYQCDGGVKVRRAQVKLNYQTATLNLANSLNDSPGVLLASSFEYPGRYTRWDIGFVNPPIRISAQGRSLRIDALNRRGEILLPEIFAALEFEQAIEVIASSVQAIELTLKTGQEPESEELRSRQPSVFSVLCALVSFFYSEADTYSGLYGAFGYDLTFQFEDIKRFQTRDITDRDLVLYLPDQIIVADHRAETTTSYNYEFICRSWESTARTETTGGFKRSGERLPFQLAKSSSSACDHAEGEFADQVRRAKTYFKTGDLFEVVPGQTFYERCIDTPADIFSRLKKRNPAPYGALMNLGEGEYLVAASPEMFVRVDGSEIETCPISGTIKRGKDAIEDAAQIKTLLNSSKDESELSMCTDVDRNDKARVCEAGSVKVVGRRQIEMYSRLIHTVDHVKGTLQKQFDALDGFLAHTWAVTVTGAPKLAAMQYIEEYEKSPRRWYGGAIGHIGFDGNLNTGLTLRTVRIKNGIAEIRAGATLLMDSDPVDEEQETRLKASALIDAIKGVSKEPQSSGVTSQSKDLGSGLTAVMVDHQDSFVHNLAAYFRMHGVKLITLRPQAAQAYISDNEIDFVILSPGPSSPKSFGMNKTIEVALKKNLPIFGVCLGLQGIVEYFGGELKELDYPMHGKPSLIEHSGTDLFAEIDSSFTAGRYHSLVAVNVPDCLTVTAHTSDGWVMAVEHKELPVSAVQFHPESIMTLSNNVGYQLIRNVLTSIKNR
jgi:anthranilate synthase